MGVLENHWNGEILDSKEKVLGMARSMTYNGINPIVTLVEGEYIAGVKRAYVQFRGNEFHTRNARFRQPQEQRRAKAHSRQAKRTCLT